MEADRLYEVVRSFSVFVALTINVLAIGLLFVPGNIYNIAYFFGLFALFVFTIEIEIIIDTKWNERKRAKGRI